MAGNIGTHVTHCCERHGCKYGEDETCPVVQKKNNQEYPCEDCQNPWDLREKIAALKEELTWTEELAYRIGNE